MACPTAALAQPPPEPTGPPASGPAAPEATVVAIEDGHVIVDLGRASLRIVHPLSGEALEDRLPNGHVRVVQVGETMSLCALGDDVSHPPAPGDGAVGREPPPTSPSATAATEEDVFDVPPPPPSATGVPSEAREVIALHEGMVGAPLDARVAMVEAYLRDHPASPHGGWLRDTLAMLQGVQRVRDEWHAARTAPQTIRAETRHARLRRLGQGDAAEVALYVPRHRGIRAALLYMRPIGESGYERYAMTLSEVGFARAPVPEAVVVAPGFEYYVAVTVGDQSVSVAGSAERPLRCAVAPPPEAPTRVGMSQVRVATEYVSFEKLSGRDYFFVFEADATLRVGRSWLRGVRLGYGHFRGRGGDLEALDAAGLPSPEARYTYGYLEPIFRVHRLFAVSPRVLIGLTTRPGNGGARDDGGRLVGGGQLRLRIGTEDGTQLVLGAATMRDLGQRGLIGLRLAMAASFPTQVEVHVTDQPVDTNEPAVRLVLEQGFRVGDAVWLAARLSYQARTVDQFGPGLGIRTTFDW